MARRRVEAFAARPGRRPGVDAARPGDHGHGRVRTGAPPSAARAPGPATAAARGIGARPGVARRRPGRCGATPTRRCRSGGPCTARWPPSTCHGHRRRRAPARRRWPGAAPPPTASAHTPTPSSPWWAPRCARPPWRPAATRRHWRELFVAVPVGDGVLEGFVDLVARGRRRAGGGRLQDRPRSAGRPALAGAAARYGPQVASYASPSRRRRAGRCARCVLVFVGDGAAVEVVLEGAELARRGPAARRAADELLAVGAPVDPALRWRRPRAARRSSRRDPR